MNGRPELGADCHGKKELKRDGGRGGVRRRRLKADDAQSTLATKSGHTQAKTTPIPALTAFDPKEMPSGGRLQ